VFGHPIETLLEVSVPKEWIAFAGAGS
jgi:hypothetical protein